MAHAMTPSEYDSYYSKQIIFLTGGTGALGTCLLYKLSVELPTKKVYALVRSKERAMQTWKTHIPYQIDGMLASGKIELVVGDVGKVGLGIERDILRGMEAEVTVVINSAANISFKSDTTRAVYDNCLTALNVATLASSFHHLTHFIQVSTAFVTSFLPEHVPIPEIMHPLYPDPEAELHSILKTGSSSYANHFPRGYHHSKHLGERLLFSRFGDGEGAVEMRKDKKMNNGMQILVVRPPAISSAVRSPYPGYGPPRATPAEMFWRFHAVKPGNRILYPPEGAISGTGIIEEVPVDWVSNMILLHSAAGTTGIIHTSAATFVQRTFNEHQKLFQDASDPGVVWAKEGHGVEQCPAGKTFPGLTGDWRYDTSRSEWCKDVKGVLSVDVRDVDVAAYDKVRRERVRRDIEVRREERRSKDVAEKKGGEAKL